MLKESLIAASPIFDSNPYFMNEEYSLIDCTMSPLLWRLPSLGLELSSIGTSIADYANRLFAREAFQESLSDVEKDMIR
jgi:RNA polymerase-associated protein